MDAKENCYTLGFSFLCGIVDIGIGLCSLLNVSEDFCKNLSNTVVNVLDYFRTTLINIVGYFIRMRVAMRFSVNTTNEVPPVAMNATAEPAKAFSALI